MYSFKNDYSEGCHPNILEALAKSNHIQTEGYGEDPYCTEACKLIKQIINQQQAAIYFVSGGTQTNAIVIASSLRPYESVISADTGHINVHEAGAIEATGHKINPIITHNGKITIEDIQSILNIHDNHHMVKPRMVYISNATELGTIYTKQELQALYAFCKKNNLYLFLDGARAGVAIMAENNDLSLADIAQNTDIFYIGGTKNGALLGEAIVVTNDVLKNEFSYHIKQRGALMAKGRVLGIQFLELFKDNLYFTLAQKANIEAIKIKLALQKKGYLFLSDSPTNMQFPILHNEYIKKLSAQYDFYAIKKIDAQHTAIRLVTSWATPQEVVNQFIHNL